MQADDHDAFVPVPRDSTEVCLLLEAACADCQVHLTLQNLVHQVVHHNTLTFQYNHILLERAQDDLRTAEHFVGKVRFVI